MTDEPFTTATGRLIPFAPMAPDIVYPISEFAKQMQRAMSEDGTFCAVITGSDFRMMEQYVLATLMHESRGGHRVPAGTVILDLDPEGGCIESPLDRLQDFIRQMEGLEPTMPYKARAGYDLAAPVKQNGRPADYLRHDPTKRNRRRG